LELQQKRILQEILIIESGFSRRFQPIKIDEPSLDEAEEILNQVVPVLEVHHKLKIGKEAMEASLLLSDRYVTDRYLPDKAIDLLDEACASKKISIESEYEDFLK
jgi:ATP-dependent Clp protease ATP-binding subunit ClpB